MSKKEAGSEEEPTSFFEMNRYPNMAEDNRKAPIAEMRGTYIFLCVILTVLTVLAAWFFLAVRGDGVYCYLECTKRVYPCMDEYRVVILDLGPYAETSEAKPLPEPGYTDGGRTLISYDGMQEIIEYFTPSAKAQKIVYGFIAGLAVSLTAISVLLYFLIKNAQLKNRRYIIMFASLLAIVVILAGIYIASFWRKLHTLSYVEPSKEIEEVYYN